MKKSLLTFLLCFMIRTLFAQDYLISFTGDGASTTVDSVKVENLTQGTNLTMTGNQVLHLKSNITRVSSINQNQLPGIRFYPNPMNDYTQIEFDIPEPGFAHIELYDISGRIITQTNKFLNEGRHIYLITGLGSGVYFVKIKSPGNSCSGKLVSNNSALRNPGISYSQSLPYKETTETLKSATTEVLMQYANGDRLKLTGISGDNRTVVTDAPTESKTLPFTFVPCTDADGKNYSVVKIGNQWWMAENLAYLPIVKPSSASSISSPYYYIYGYEGTSVSAAKATDNYSTYGVLYNLTAALSACPSGWHLPSDAEWKQLEMALGMTQAQADGSSWRGTNQGAQMKTTSGWYNNGNGTNASGFSDLPGGYRDYHGYFYSITNNGFWWSSTEDEFTPGYFYCRKLGYFDSRIFRGIGFRTDGQSVRYVRDSETTGLPPASDFTATTTTPTVGQVVQFNDKSSNSPSSWFWDFGDGTTSTEQNPSKSYSSVGTYSVSLKATNSYGNNTKTLTNYITVTNKVDTITYGSFTDPRDNKTYKTVTIGKQIWMAENLAYLPAVNTPTDGSYTIPYYYVYGYDGTEITTAKATVNYNTYGVLYNWSAALTACPSGWHLPSDAEWKQMEMALGMTQAQSDSIGTRGTNQGTQMKTTKGWYNNGNGTNVSGFSSLPGGYLNNDGGFYSITRTCRWWSSTVYHTYNAWIRILDYDNYLVIRDFNYSKNYGFSIRCVKD